MYNDTVVLHRNEYERDTDEMILLLKQIKDDTYSGKVRFQGEDTNKTSTVFHSVRAYSDTMASLKSPDLHVQNIHYWKLYHYSDTT